MSKRNNNSQPDTFHILDPQGRVRPGMGLSRLSRMDAIKWKQRQEEKRRKREDPESA